MIQVKEQVDLHIQYNLSNIGDLSSLLFFDIETTGLSVKNSSLYLIGCLYFEKNRPCFIQWMAESLSDELPLLENFFEFASRFDTLVSFNGSVFDLNYLIQCAGQYHVSCPLSEMKSFDILKEVRHYKKIFGLESLRQKSIECFLGIHREDQFSGGELIPVYEAYTESKEERLKKILLLHNREDVLGMTEILPVLHFVDFFKNPELSVSEYRFSKSGRTMEMIAGPVNDKLFFPCKLNYQSEEGIQISLCKQTVELHIPSYCGELKYFYPNFREYYYLPAEDTAIHKKIANFVDKNHRVQATKENCYQKIAGEFLIAPKGCTCPTFRSSYEDSCLYIQFEPENFFRYLQFLF